MGILYVQTAGHVFSTNAAQFTPIQDLNLVLPEGSGSSALIVLNIPNPYGEGNNYPGGTFCVSVNGKLDWVQATFTYSQQQPSSYGRMPTTLVTAVQLLVEKQTVQAMWQGVRGSTVIIDSPASLSAVW